MVIPATYSTASGRHGKERSQCPTLVPKLASYFSNIIVMSVLLMARGRAFQSPPAKLPQLRKKMVVPSPTPSVALQSMIQDFQFLDSTTIKPSLVNNQLGSVSAWDNNDNQLAFAIGNWVSQSGANPAALGSPSTSSQLLAADSPSISKTKPDRPPTKDEIQLLQKAFAAFYGTTDRNVEQAVDLLTKTIQTWEETHQPGDEIAGLYRVRGDANMELFQPKKAEQDYSKSIQLLDGPDGGNADPEERPASRIGRARAVRSLGMSADSNLALQASNDYETYFSYISRLDVDDEEGDLSKNKAETGGPAISDAVIDGIQRNPYAAWEWGMVSRVAGKYDQAAEVHRLAAKAFEEIGDKPRAVISQLDGGIDLAAGLGDNVNGSKGNGKGNKEGGDYSTVRKLLEKAIESTVNVEGRDVELLQRVVSKEGEARVALSGVLWTFGDKAAAESQFGEACGRLDELNADYQSREQERIKKGRMPPPKVQRIGFSIDDIPGAEEASCSRFKNEKYIDEKLVWPDSLKVKVNKFLTLSK